MKKITKDVLTYLEEHGTITPQKAIRSIGCYSLAARIYELRHQEGIVISKTMKKAVRKDGTAVHFAEYKLEATP